MFSPVVTAQGTAPQAMVNAFAAVPSSAPAVGNMPVQVVSAPIHAVKVADNRPNASYLRSPAPETSATDITFSASYGVYNDVYLDFPHSSPFVAQLFGQLNMEGGEQASFFVDYEMLTQFEEIKYKPSFAFRPHESLMADMAERQKVFLEKPSPEAASMQHTKGEMDVQEQAQPVRERGNPSLYSEGVSAYTAQESRNVMEAIPVKDMGYKKVSAVI